MGAGEFIGLLVLLFLLIAVGSRILTASLSRRPREHEWEPIPPGGPLEEGGVCRRCRAWATSEGHLPCNPDKPAWD